MMPSFEDHLYPNLGLSIKKFFKTGKKRCSCSTSLASWYLTSFSSSLTRSSLIYLYFSIKEIFVNRFSFNFEYIKLYLTHLNSNLYKCNLIYMSQAFPIIQTINPRAKFSISLTIYMFD